MKTYAVRTTGEEATRLVKAEIQRLDTASTIDSEGNPTTFWVATTLTEDDIEKLEGVEEVVKSCWEIESHQAARKLKKALDDGIITRDEIIAAINRGDTDDIKPC